MSSIYKPNNKGPSIDPLVRKGFKYNGYINALYGGYKKVGCFGVFTKLKRCMELVFTAGFLHTFSIKLFLIKYHISFNN